MKFSVITPAKTFHELYHNLNWHNYDFFTKKKRKYYYVKSNSKKKHFFHIQPKYNIFNSYPFLSPSSRSRFHYKRQSFPKQTFFQQNHIELQKTHSSPKLFHSITREVFRKKGEPISTFWANSSDPPTLKNVRNSRRLLVRWKSYVKYDTLARKSIEYTLYHARFSDRTFGTRARVLRTTVP